MYEPVTTGVEIGAASVPMRARVLSAGQVGCPHRGDAYTGRVGPGRSDRCICLDAAPIDGHSMVALPLFRSVRLCFEFIEVERESEILVSLGPAVLIP